MRELDVAKITQAVEELYRGANYALSPDMECALRNAAPRERSPLGRDIFGQMMENLDAAKANNVPICQDTGMAVVFLDIGQEVYLTGGPLEEAVNIGISRACYHGYLRASVVQDPLRRVNTGDNTPAVLHIRIVPGDRVDITVMPKGFGSENMSAMRMFTPAATAEDVTDFVVESVARAGSNPCPPVVVGVGLGGTADMAALLAKRAMLRPMDQPHADPFYAKLEHSMLRAVNRLGIGPQGLGGSVTALRVSIATYPTHIAGMPCAVNIGCHVTRHAHTTI